MKVQATSQTDVVEAGYNLLISRANLCASSSIWDPPRVIGNVP